MNIILSRYLERAICLFHMMVLGDTQKSKKNLHKHVKQRFLLADGDEFPDLESGEMTRIHPFFYISALFHDRT